MNNKMNREKDLILREEGFILDCQSAQKSKLPEYNPFNDRYMGYMFPVENSSSHRKSVNREGFQSFLHKMKEKTLHRQ